MTNELKVFESAEFGSVRVVEKDGEPWFVARDVCSILGFDDGDTNRALSGLDSDEKATTLKISGRHDFKGLRKDSPLVSEPGLYSLILRSNKPEAKAFKRWVTHDVLPAIRKTGVYADKARVDPAFLRQLADELEEKNLQLKAARPAVNLCNRLTEYRTEWRMGIAAKEVGAPVNIIRDVCVTKGILERVNSYGRIRFLPTKKAERLGLCVREPGGEKYAFTLSGIAWLRLYVPA